jgi:hypothetical protein
MRTGPILCGCLGILGLVATTAAAQPRSEYELYVYGLAAEELEARVKPENPRDIALALDIAQRYGISGASGVWPWEADALVGEMEAIGEVLAPLDPARPVRRVRMPNCGRAADFGFMQDSAARLKYALLGVSGAWGAAAWYARYLAWATRFQGPLALAAATTASYSAVMAAYEARIERLMELCGATGSEGPWMPRRAS